MRVRDEANQLDMHAALGSYQPAMQAALVAIQNQNIMQRIWDHDPTVWGEESTEISDRLGWLHMPGAMPYSAPRMQALLADLLAEGYTHALLLGMGGSSLAPEVFARTFGLHAPHPPAGPALELAVLDSTHPEAVLAQARRLDPARTLFIVSTKSGGTVETLSFFKYFYNLVAGAVDVPRAGEHFIAITDPGSKLAQLAAEYQFRATFLNDPTIGGRYSVLSFFGLLPATLAGVEVTRLLERARQAASACANAQQNPGAALGAIMGALAQAGRDKVTFVLSPAVASFGDWVEQLIAESTGKDGRGILPVVGEDLADPGAYDQDRLFVHLRLAGDSTHDAALQALEEAGHPVVRMALRDVYDLGQQFFLWEMATAVAGHLLGIQPFDQPDVESAKVLARKMVAAFQESGTLSVEMPSFEAGGVSVYGEWPPTRRLLRTAGDVVLDFVTQSRRGDYVAIQAYVAPSPEVDAALAHLRGLLQRQLRLATTVGYGPRFLHSTGQLHKGDAGNGVFVQITAAPNEDAPIPDKAGEAASAMTFGTLILSQALGDRQALLDGGRRVLRFHLDEDVIAGLANLARSPG